MTEGDGRIQAVDVRNFNMSFGRMVVFMIKWAIATIPALIILIVVGYIAVAVLGGGLGVFDRDTTVGRSLNRNFGNASLPSSHLSRAEFEAELERAHALLMAGKPWDAYSVARSLEGRTSGAQKAAAQSLMDNAWKQTQRPKR